MLDATAKRNARARARRLLCRARFGSAGGMPTRLARLARGLAALLDSECSAL
jgi:hypothetical protein